MLPDDFIFRVTLKVNNDTGGVDEHKFEGTEDQVSEQMDVFGGTQTEPFKDEQFVSCFIERVLS